MRLSLLEKNAILNAIKQRDEAAEIFLFGSRTNPIAKGGDIDILVYSNILSFSDKIKIKMSIFNHIPEQKIDIIIKKRNENDAFLNVIKPQLIPIKE